MIIAITPLTVRCVSIAVDQLLQTLGLHGFIVQEVKAGHNHLIYENRH